MSGTDGNAVERLNSEIEKAKGRAHACKEDTDEKYSAYAAAAQGLMDDYEAYQRDKAAPIKARIDELRKKSNDLYHKRNVKTWEIRSGGWGVLSLIAYIVLAIIIGDSFVVPVVDSWGWSFFISLVMAFFIAWIPAKLVPAIHNSLVDEVRGRNLLEQTIIDNQIEQEEEKLDEIIKYTIEEKSDGTIKVMQNTRWA